MNAAWTGDPQRSMRERRKPTPWACQRCGNGVSHHAGSMTVGIRITKCSRCGTMDRRLPSAVELDRRAGWPLPERRLIFGYRPNHEWGPPPGGLSWLLVGELAALVAVLAALAVVVRLAWLGGSLS